MNESKTYTEQEAHRFFAIDLNGKVWSLLDKPQRSAEEDEAMIHAAHASCYHWMAVGTPVHHQRGEWMIARVYTVLGIADAALRHAYRCLELTEAHREVMEDFDLAYAYECVARAHALAGQHEEALRYLQVADEAGKAISDEQNRQIFEQDCKGGNWYGVND